MQVCGFVDGFVGGRIYLPLPSLPPFVFCFFVFGYRPLSTGIQKTTSAAGERWQRILKCVGEVVLTLFCAENEGD